MATEAGEELRSEAVVMQVGSRDGVQQVETGDGAARAMRLAILVRQYERWPAGAVDDP